MIFPSQGATAIPENLILSLPEVAEIALEDAESAYENSRLEEGYHAYSLAIQETAGIASLDSIRDYLRTRRADCLWRIESAKRDRSTVDSTKIEFAKQELEKIIIACEGGDPFERMIAALASESLANSFWYSEGKVRIDLIYRALEFWENALEDQYKDHARERILAMVLGVGISVPAGDADYAEGVDIVRRDRLLPYQKLQQAITLTDNLDEIARLELASCFALEIENNEEARIKQFLFSARKKNGRLPTEFNWAPPEENAISLQWDRALSAAENSRFRAHIHWQAFQRLHWMAHYIFPRTIQPAAIPGAITPPSPLLNQAHEVLTETEMDRHPFSSFVPGRLGELERVTLQILHDENVLRFLPGRAIDYQLVWQNIESLDVTLYKTNIYTIVRPDRIKDFTLEKLTSGLSIDWSDKVTTWSYQPGQHKLKGQWSGSFKMADDLGRGGYILEAKSSQRTDRTLVLNSDLMLLAEADPDSLLVWACGATDGNPRPKTSVTVWARIENNKWVRLIKETNPHGFAYIPLEKNLEGATQFLVIGENGDDLALKEVGFREPQNSPGIARAKGGVVPRHERLFLQETDTSIKQDFPDRTSGETRGYRADELKASVSPYNEEFRWDAYRITRDSEQDGWIITYADGSPAIYADLSAHYEAHPSEVLQQRSNPDQYKPVVVPVLTGKTNLSGRAQLAVPSDFLTSWNFLNFVQHDWYVSISDYLGRTERGLLWGAGVAERDLVQPDPTWLTVEDSHLLRSGETTFWVHSDKPGTPVMVHYRSGDRIVDAAYGKTEDTGSGNGAAKFTLSLSKENVQAPLGEKLHATASIVRDGLIDRTSLELNVYDYRAPLSLEVSTSEASDTGSESESNLTYRAKFTDADGRPVRGEVFFDLVPKEDYIRPFSQRSPVEITVFPSAETDDEGTAQHGGEEIAPGEYYLVARGISHDGQEVYAYTEIEVTPQPEPIVVETNVPDFLREGDQTEIRVTVQNNTGAPLRANYRLKFSGLHSSLIMSEGEEFPSEPVEFTLNPDESMDLTWAVQARRDGETEFHFLVTPLEQIIERNDEGEGIAEELAVETSEETEAERASARPIQPVTIKRTIAVLPAGLQRFHTSVAQINGDTSETLYQIDWPEKQPPGPGEPWNYEIAVAAQPLAAAFYLLEDTLRASPVTEMETAAHGMSCAVLAKLIRESGISEHRLEKYANVVSNRDTVEELLDARAAKHHFVLPRNVSSLAFTTFAMTRFLQETGDHRPELAAIAIENLELASSKLLAEVTTLQKEQETDMEFFGWLTFALTFSANELDDRKLLADENLQAALDRLSAAADDPQCTALVRAFGLLAQESAGKGSRLAREALRSGLRPTETQTTVRPWWPSANFGDCLIFMAAGATPQGLFDLPGVQLLAEAKSGSLLDQAVALGMVVPTLAERPLIPVETEAQLFLDGKLADELSFAPDDPGDQLLPRLTSRSSLAWREDASLDPYSPASILAEEQGLAAPERASLIRSGGTGTLYLWQKTNLHGEFPPRTVVPNDQPLQLDPSRPLRFTFALAPAETLLRGMTLARRPLEQRDDLGVPVGTHLEGALVLEVPDSAPTASLDLPLPAGTRPVGTTEEESAATVFAQRLRPGSASHLIIDATAKRPPFAIAGEQVALKAAFLREEGKLSLPLFNLQPGEWLIRYDLLAEREGSFHCPPPMLRQVEEIAPVAGRARTTRILIRPRNSTEDQIRPTGLN